MDDRLEKARDGFSEIRKREMGFSRPLSFARRFSASEGLVKKLNLYKKLNGHNGCVNAIEFNSTGDLLVSGSDDRDVIFWNWETESKKFSYASGHEDNIFQTKIMPYTDDCKIVTSAGDGQVRLGRVSEDGQVRTKRLGKHKGRVYKLAVEPGSPNIFYSCGGDGFVQHFDLRCAHPKKILCTSPFTEDGKGRSNIVRLNSIVIDPRDPNYFAVAGSDEFARLYDMRKYQWDASSNLDNPVNSYCPRHLIKNDNVHITGLAYSNTSELLVSYNDELIYLFQKNAGLGPSPLSLTPEYLDSLPGPQVYSGHRNAHTVKGVNFFGPSCEYVVSGSDCGHIFIWKKERAELVRLMSGDQHIVNQLELHPYLPFMASCGIEKNVKIWTPMAIDKPPLPVDAEKIMEANKRGREDHSRILLTPDVIMHVLRLQRRQTTLYTERSGRSDIEGNEDGEPALLLGFTDGDMSSEEDSGGNLRGCNIS